jgi:hypothetical protein
VLAVESVFLSLLLLRYEAPPTVLEFYPLTLFSRYSSTLASRTFQGEIPHIPAICDHFSPLRSLLACRLHCSNPAMSTTSRPSLSSDKYLLQVCTFVLLRCGFKFRLLWMLQSPLFAIYARPMDIVQSLCPLLSGGRVSCGIFTIPPYTSSQ